MQRLEMLQHLTNTWRKLMGEEIVFIAQQAAQVTACDGQLFFLITLQPFSSASQAGVGLGIAGPDARRLAARMFGESAEVVTDADIADACRELSNVFASGLTSDKAEHAELELGLPVSLSAEVFHEILQASCISQGYLAAEAGHHIHVLVFERLVLPQAVDKAATS